MLKNLPIIPSKIFTHNLTNITYYSFNFTGSVTVMSKMHTKLLGNGIADVQRYKMNYPFMLVAIYYYFLSD